MSTAVVGIVNDQSIASTLVDQLRSHGFKSNDISVLMSDKTGTRDFALSKSTKAPEGAATGAGTGGILGGTLGLLAGIGLLAIPGLGPFIAAGPIMAALSGAAVGAAVGGIAGSLIGLGIPEYEAKQYEGKITSGSVLVSVHSVNSGETKRAKEIFERAGVEDISTTSEATVPDKDSVVRAHDDQARKGRGDGPLAY